MNLQKRLDLIETYRNTIKVLPHLNSGIEYTVIPGPKIKSDPVKAEAGHDRKEKSKR